jgi:hypothetical protein
MSVKAVGSVGAMNSVEGVASLASVGPVRAPDAVRGAVEAVAVEIRAGRVDPGTAAVDAVIARFARSQVPPATPEARIEERTAMLQAVLGTDPSFAVRVQRLLDEALRPA